MPDWDTQLSHRARRILHAVVTEYLSSGAAVGSRTVTRRHGIDLSPATVRNVMFDLEEMGLLVQPHTSAGRIPTKTGLRFFIDRLLKVRALSGKEKDEIRARCAGESLDVDDVVQRISKVLAETTQHAGIVLAPNPSLQRLQHIEFVPLQGGRVLCVLVTTEGRIENKLIQAEFPVDERRLERVHNYLDALLGGLTLREVREVVLRELGVEKNQYDAMVSEALRLSKAAFEHPPAAAVVVTGKANLLDDAATGDPDHLARMRDLLRTLEDKELMVKLLDRTLDAEGIQVFLGGEIALPPLDDASVVATSYGPEERPLGAIAVIGPTRMNYGKVMSIVDFTAEWVSRLIADY